MCALDSPCEQLVYIGRYSWSECGRRPARLVTFPRTPPMVLCEDHERDASNARARVSLQSADAEGSK